MRTAPILWLINTLAPSWRILYPKVLELSLRSVGFFMSLCPYAYLELSLSGSLTASDQGSLATIGEFLNISALDPLLPTFLIATLCLCALSVITYYSLTLAWEVFWASRQSPSPLDPSAEVVLTQISNSEWVKFPGDLTGSGNISFQFLRSRLNFSMLGWV